MVETPCERELHSPSPPATVSCEAELQVVPGTPPPLNTVSQQGIAEACDKPFSRDDKVHGKFMGKWYPGTVREIHSTGHIKVYWDEEPTYSFLQIYDVTHRAPVSNQLSRADDRAPSIHHGCHPKTLEAQSADEEM